MRNESDYLLTVTISGTIIKHQVQGPRSHRCTTGTQTRNLGSLHCQWQPRHFWKGRQKLHQFNSSILLLSLDIQGTPEQWSNIGQIYIPISELVTEVAFSIKEVKMTLMGVTHPWWIALWKCLFYFSIACKVAWENAFKCNHLNFGSSEVRWDEMHSVCFLLLELRVLFCGLKTRWARPFISSERRTNNAL